MAAALRGELSPSDAIDRTPRPSIWTPAKQGIASAALQGLQLERPATVTHASHAAFASVALPAWEDDVSHADAWLTSTEPPARCASRRLGSHPLDWMVHLGLDHASIDGKRGKMHTGVKAWFAFVDGERLSAHRPMDLTAPLYARLQEELLAMRFCCALIEVRGISVKSAANYFSAVQGWHLREHGVKIGAGIKFERLPQMLKGLRRKFGDPTPRTRRGISPTQLRRAMDLVLDPRDPWHANVRAALATAFQGLLRSAEYAIDPGKRFDFERNISRADIKLLTESVVELMMAPCKNMHHLKGKSCPLVIGAGGQYIDAVAEIRNMLAVDPRRPGEDAAKTPLFRRPGTYEPLRTSEVLAITRQLMKAVGENPADFGTHSYRIGGATALFAAGADETVIRTMGRWSSDIYRLYVRACFERCAEWTRRAGSTQVTDVARTIDEVDDY